MSARAVLINGWMKPRGLGERNRRGILKLMGFHVTETVTVLHYHLSKILISLTLRFTWDS